MVCSFQVNQQTSLAVLQRVFSTVKPQFLCGWENALWFNSSVHYMHVQVTPEECIPDPVLGNSSPPIMPLSLCRLFVGTGYLMYVMPWIRKKISQVALAEFLSLALHLRAVNPMQ